MASEVMDLQYLFFPLAHSSWAAEPGYTILVNPIPFHYNSIHDLESIWWCLTWLFFFNHCHVKCEETRIRKMRYSERRKAMDKLFPEDISRTNARSRLTFLDFPNNLLEYLDSSSCGPEESATLQMKREIKKLLVVTTDITECYRNFEAKLKKTDRSLSPPSPNCEGLYARLHEVFNKGSDIFNGVDMVPVKEERKNAIRRLRRTKTGISLGYKS